MQALLANWQVVFADVFLYDQMLVQLGRHVFQTLLLFVSRILSDIHKLSLSRSVKFHQHEEV